MHYSSKIVLAALILCLLGQISCGDSRQLSYRCQTTPSPLEPSDDWTVLDDGAIDKPDYNNRCGDDHALFDNRYAPYIGGDEQVDLVVEEVVSFGCPHCADFYDNLSRLLAEHPAVRKRVRFYLHHMIWSGWESRHAAVMAAAQLGPAAFEAMEMYLFQSQNKPISKSDMVDFATTELGATASTFEAQLDNQSALGLPIYQYLAQDTDRSGDSCGNRTPAVYVCGKVLYDWHDLHEIIDSLL